jgi:hypothetical protein
MPHEKAGSVIAEYLVFRCLNLWYETLVLICQVTGFAFGDAVTHIHPSSFVIMNARRKLFQRSAGLGTITTKQSHHPASRGIRFACKDILNANLFNTFTVTSYWHITILEVKKLATFKSVRVV